MKRKLYALALLMAGISGVEAQNTPVSPMEKLTRGVVSVPAASGTGRFVSWRFFGTDTDNTSFDLMRDGKTIATDLFGKTNYVDKAGFASSKYQVVTKVKGQAVDTSEDCEIFTNDIFKSIQLDRPAGGTDKSGAAYTYSPNDCSVGDIDGDGNYELFVKWDPSNSKDNSQSGYTGNVFIDCYKLDGTKLWRIDLGPNIRAGAHYTQFMVYDFDGDGKVEMMLKTAPGSKDSEGNYVSAAADDETIKNVDNTKDWRNSSGKVTGGQEYLTVFNGETGKAIHTVFYRPNRAPSSDATPNWGGAPSWTFNWDDRSGKTDTSYGNRGERYLAAVAYLDGYDKNPSGVFSRGYYTWAYVWAVDFDGEKLTTKWLHASTSKTKTAVYDADGNKIFSGNHTKNSRGSTGSKTMYGNGNHNLSVGDVDGDGCDEIIWGSAALDNDGQLLYSVGFGHGDAIHLSDLMPDRPGLEVFQVHEESPYGWDLHDARTGEIIYSATSSGDNGRGMAADVDATNKGAEFWSSAKDGTHSSVDGKSISSNQGSINFRIYWTGDIYEQLFDGGYSSTNGGCTPKVTRWNGNGTSEVARLTGDHSRTCNTTKATPCLQADLFGDWREEIIMWNGEDPSKINIYTTNTETEYRVPTLMHDHIYRMGVAWQNTAYNQPPHLGYWLPGSFTSRYAIMGEGEFEQTVALGDDIKPIEFKWVNCSKPTLIKSIEPDGTVTENAACAGFTFVVDQFLTKSATFKGKPSKLGTYEFVLESGANVVDNQKTKDTIRIHCADPAGILGVKTNSQDEWVKLSGGQFSDRIVLQFNLKETQNVRIGLYNMAGAQVYGLNYEIGHTAPLEVYGLGHIPAGIYMLKVESGEGTFTKKIIKR
ncbi:MAG: T9SS type A sorting domain-containing protein [Prevotella sp.]|nr:T9SS type A sorting domain-containing protein [Prevotella sp.]